jgi:LemA protein
MLFQYFHLICMKTRLFYMKKLTRLLSGFAVLLFLATSLSSCGYNSMVTKREAVAGQWSQVENVYQRRLDLIPNLVAAVKAAANFEKSTMIEVTEARAGAARNAIKNVDPSSLTQEQIQQFQKTQDALGNAVRSMINVVVERYPDLKSNQNFLSLQNQLEGTENRIAVERGKFNTVVQDYNTYIQRFPQNISAGIFGFKPKGYFQASEGADKAPDVNSMFNDNNNAK